MEIEKCIMILKEILLTPTIKGAKFFENSIKITPFRFGEIILTNEF